MSKIKKQIKLVKKSSIIAFAFLVVALTPVINSSQNQVFADPYEQKINELNSNIDQNQKKIADLKTQGDTLANKLESARLETANLQSKIDANEAKNAQLKGQIVEAEAKITENKKILANSIRKLYIDGDISSLEILASSKSLSDYVDKQEYRDRVKNKIATLTSQVEDLKAQMEKQQVEIENLIRDQVGMRVDLQTKQDEVQKLLNDTRGQEDAYQRQVAADNSEVARLRREQAAANSARLTPRNGGISYVPSSGVTNGGYPTLWATAAQDSLVDSWGMYNRECVSYTAFKVYQSGRYMPYWGGRGNANRWPANARAAGIPVDGNPRVGDVAISMSGYYGHAMYVERVNGDGTIRVSQYNYGIRGEYSEMTISPAGLYFIHF
ncbi:MAG: CHAP domain-containing protein [Candidatus Nomurabacteria bacterium]|nr:MAG: CHAP domain-containing protein [Candidatus Nomurabacteria bacterium]HRV75778.1 CHAP domain-containing protein [Candidatus Saccharimonadales bacterium]